MNDQEWEALFDECIAEAMDDEQERIKSHMLPAAIKIRGLVSDSVTQAAANKAAEEGGLPTPRAIMDVVDEFGSGTTCYIAEDLRAAIASAIAADRASRQVANKAEVETIDTSEFRELLAAFKNSSIGFDYNETVKNLVAHINGRFATPPATTGASTVLTDERTAALIEARDAVGEFRKNIDIFSESKQDAALAALDGALHAIDALIGEFAAQAGQVAVPGWLPIESAPRDGSLILLGRAEDEVEDRNGESVPGRWHEEDHDGPDNMGHDAGFMDDSYQGTFFCGRSFGCKDYQNKGYQPTHWMPLPPSPAKESK